MEYLNQIISNPLYILLFGGGGILAITIAIIGLLKDKNKKRKNRNKINNNEELIMDNNKIKGEIKVENNKNVVISNNEFMDS